MFGTSGIRGRVGEDVTADLAMSVGHALAAETDSVVVGRDPRSSGRFLTDALSAGLRECGTDVVRLGVAATPTVARSVAWRDADAGVSITASHNPPPDNGIKLWQPSGQAYDEAGRGRIESRIMDDSVDRCPWDEVGEERRWTGARDRHAAAVGDVVGDADLSVVVDLGNGAGGVTVDALVGGGCEVETLNAQPDGRFPGRPSEPNGETLDSLSALVAGTDADLGVAHDGDADRMLAVDDRGRFVPKDALLALFARESVDPGDVVAVPVGASLAVDDAVASRDASVTRTAVGDVYVAERASESDVTFGGEPSGAWIWPDETLCPDGSLAAAKLVSLVDERGPLSGLVDGVPQYPTRRDSIEVDDERAVMDRVRDRVLTAYDDVDTLDGVRVDLGDAWFLLRPSGTQPLVRVTAEARDQDRAEQVFDEARGLVDGVRVDA